MFKRFRRVALIMISAMMVVSGMTNAGATDLTVSGSGWGDGVGLSQYGARAMADAGDSASQILSHYFPGVQVRTLDTLLIGSYLLTDDAPVWVGLLQDRSQITFHIEEGSAELCLTKRGNA